MLTNQETWRSQLPLNDIDKGIRHFLTIPFFLELNEKIRDLFPQNSIFKFN